MSSLVILNPAACAGCAKRKRGELQRLFSRYLEGSVMEETIAPGDATVRARRALEKGFTHIVAAGGDGTVNEVANGFFIDDKLINPDASLSIVPLGSGNDFISAVGVSNDIETAVRRCGEGKDFLIDVGKACVTTAEGGKSSRYFVNYGDFGFSAEVAAWFNRHRHGFLSTLWYFFGVIAAWKERRHYDVEALIDGKTVQISNVLLGIVCNGTSIGGGMKVAPRAVIDDGLFDVYLAKVSKFKKMLPILTKVYSGVHQENEDILYFRAKRVDVRISNDVKVRVGMEGEQPGFLPAEYTMMPRALKLKV